MKDHYLIGGPLYTFSGFLFELHSRMGPIPIGQDLDPTNEEPSDAFYDAVEDFLKLPKRDRRYFTYKNPVKLTGRRIKA